MPFAPTDQLSCPPEVLSRIMGGEAVILHLGSGTYFGMNDVGSRAWEHVQAGTTFGALSAALLAEFDVDEGELERDLTAFVENLLERKLLTVTKAA